MSIDIRSKAQLVALHISSWSARKYDKKVTDKVIADHGAKGDVGRFNKSLLPGDAVSYKALTQFMSQMRTAHYEQTLDWPDEGFRLLPIANDTKYRDLIQSSQSTLENELLPAFISDYPSLKEEARRLLNGMFKEEDYPGVNLIREKFNIVADYSPIPEANFKKLALASGLQEKLERDLEARVARATESAMDDAWTRLHDCVSHLHERLATPGAIFRDSLIENVREVCDVLKRLNVTQDPALERMRATAMSSLLQYSPETLRNSTRIRNTTAATAADLMAEISGSRRIIRAQVA